MSFIHFASLCRSSASIYRFPSVIIIIVAALISSKMFLRSLKKMRAFINQEHLFENVLTLPKLLFELLFLDLRIKIIQIFLELTLGRPCPQSRIILLYLIFIQPGSKTLADFEETYLKTL